MKFMFCLNLGLRFMRFAFLKRGNPCKYGSFLQIEVSVTSVYVPDLILGFEVLFLCHGFQGHAN